MEEPPIINKISKNDFEILANKFLIETEKIDKTKPPWMTKNHVSNLYDNIKEFYTWLEKNYWNV